MASTTVQKHQTSNGIAEHDYRVSENHSNTNIDKSQIHRNEVLWGSPTLEGYREKLKKRITEADEKNPPLRKKKDRVQLVTFEICAPREGMSEEESDKFFEEMVEAYKKQFGEENVIAAIVHKDEVGTYIDPKDGKEHTSRHHMHIHVVPFVPGKGINGDMFFKQASVDDKPSKHYIYKKANEMADEVCERQFGYKYQDGTKAKSRGTVEEMKQKSAIAKTEKLEKQVTTKTKQLEELEQCLSDTQAALSNVTEQLILKDEQIAEKEAEIEEQKAEISELGRVYAKRINKMGKQLSSAVERLSKIEQGLDILNTTYNQIRNVLDGAKKTFQKYLSESIYKKVSEEIDGAGRRITPAECVIEPLKRQISKLREDIGEIQQENEIDANLDELKDKADDYELT